MKIDVVYSDRYYVDIGTHVFPTAKYKLIKEKLARIATIMNKVRFVEPPPAEEKAACQAFRGNDG